MSLGTGPFKFVPVYRNSTTRMYTHVLSRNESWRTHSCIRKKFTQNACLGYIQQIHRTGSLRKQKKSKTITQWEAIFVSGGFLFVPFYIGVVENSHVSRGYLVLFSLFDTWVIVDSILVRLSVSDRESGLTEETLIVTMSFIGTLKAKDTHLECKFTHEITLRVQTLLQPCLHVVQLIQ